MRIGIDIGGTFTDIVVFDEKTGEVERSLKIPSFGAITEKGISAGLKRCLSQLGHEPVDVRYIMHGSTIGVNTLLEKNGAIVGLVTTKGFRDVYELGRQWRGKDVYNLLSSRTNMLLPRKHIYEVKERVNARGEVVCPLDIDGVGDLVQAISDEGLESLAVVFLFSFSNPEHERAVRELIQRELPILPISISSEVNPEYREYERTSTTVVDAYIKPRVVEYVKALDESLQSAGFQAEVFLMKSSGGIARAEHIQCKPVETLFSGPAAGMAGACYFAEVKGWSHLVTLDMGGTSTDMGLIIDGKPPVSRERFVGGSPINVPMIDITSIGNGGGSIAWVLGDRVMKVGPRSAGAMPGPACYGRGGEEPTVTDACLVLGLLGDALLGGEVVLDKERALKAIERHIAQPLGIGVIEAAQAIVDVALAQTRDAMRLVTVARGYDPSDFALFSYGGATSLFAAKLAADLGIPVTVVPLNAGVFSAFGLLASDEIDDVSLTEILPVRETPPERISEIFQHLDREALARAGSRSEGVVLEHMLDMRYIGQAHELTIPVPTDIVWDERRLNEAVERFQSVNELRYGQCASEAPVQFVTFRVRARRPMPRPPLRKRTTLASMPPSPSARRELYFGDFGWVNGPVFQRTDLEFGHRVGGPAVVEEATSTIIVYPGQTLQVDEYLNLVIADDH